MPVRRLLSTRPIDTSTWTTSRAMVREALNSPHSHSKVITEPTGRAPSTMRGPSSASTPRYTVDMVESLAIHDNAPRTEGRDDLAGSSDAHRRHGSERHGEDLGGRADGGEARYRVRRRRHVPSGEQHREDVGGDPARRRRPPTLARGTRR